jgi:hypothetical protein
MSVSLDPNFVISGFRIFSQASSPVFKTATLPIGTSSLFSLMRFKEFEIDSASKKFLAGYGCWPEMFFRRKINMKFLKRFKANNDEVPLDKVVVWQTGEPSYTTFLSSFQPWHNKLECLPRANNYHLVLHLKVRCLQVSTFKKLALIFTSMN